jgi:S1-C subfamily serine protease
MTIAVGHAVGDAASATLRFSPGWAPFAASSPANSPLVNSSIPSDEAVDLAVLAATVNPALVDVNTQLGYQNAEAAGTGIVLTPSGEVLTNNHVINGATSISVTDIGNGQTYPATVVGYDRSHDIAVLQLQGASGLRTAPIGDSSEVAIGNQIAAIGNAGGVGGTPSTTTGTVSGLNQTIAVSDDSSESAQRLTGLIQVAASVQPGDSGGPLVNAAGQVIGINTAGSSGTQFDTADDQGYAIPINDAIAVGKQIRRGTGSPTVHIGPTGVLGVAVQDAVPHERSHRHGRFGSQYFPDVSGAVVADVLPGSPAEQAGLSQGDTITSLNGTAVDSFDTLTTLLVGKHPGDQVRLEWASPFGQRQAATVQLVAGPPN